MKENPLNELIKEYIACAKYSCELLMDLYNTNDRLLVAKNDKLLPKEGVVGDIQYRFHGRGCLFKYPNDEIDIDFGMGGRFDGFDAYRLKRFLAYRKDRFPLLQDEKEFDKLFKNFVDTKYIIKDPRDPDDHLYFINNNS